jgi:hypothetical protein
MLQMPAYSGMYFNRTHVDMRDAYNQTIATDSDSLIQVVDVCLQLPAVPNLTMTSIFGFCLNFELIR